MNQDKTLLINFSKRIQKNYKFKYYYQIGVLSNYPSDKICVNDQSRLNNIAYKEKNDYSDWIYSINKIFLKNKLTINDDLSLFFLTDLSNKRSEIFDTYNNICNILLLKEIIKEKGINKILINGASVTFINSIKSFLKIEIKILNKKYNLKAFKNSLLINILKHFRLIFKYLIYRIFLVVFIKNKNKKYTCKTIFFTKYPLHFLEDTNLEEKYTYLVKKDDKYITNLHSDGLHQSLSIFSSLACRIKIHQENSDKHIIVDDHVTFKDLLFSILDILRLYLPFKNIRDKKYFYKNIDISLSIKNEFNFSLQRVLGLLICYRAIDKILKSVTAEKYIYYAHEFAFGRMITYSLHRRKKLNTFGMQHGVPSRRKLCFNLSSNEIPDESLNYLKKVPLPRRIIVEDEESKILYQDFGYKKFIVMDEIPRLYYLKNFKISPKRKKNLVVPGLHDFEIIYKDISKVVKDNPHENFYIKPHPRSNINFNRFKFPKNVKITNKHISDLLAEAKLVYVTYSSVGFEAKSLNIPVIEIQCPGFINESGLND